jgi:hypothetical protein
MLTCEKTASVGVVCIQFRESIAITRNAIKCAAVRNRNLVWSLAVWQRAAARCRGLGPTMHLRRTKVL